MGVGGGAIVLVESLLDCFGFLAEQHRPNTELNFDYVLGAGLCLPRCASISILINKLT
jgi:hypothetical protein